MVQGTILCAQCFQHMRQLGLGKNGMICYNGVLVHSVPHLKMVYGHLVLAGMSTILSFGFEMSKIALGLY